MGTIQDAQRIICGIADSCQREVREALDGNLEPYRYCEIEDEEWGTQDANYNRRKQLSMALVYGSWYGALAEPEMENLVRALFLEEVLHRENNSFQGIGPCLEILTELLAQYHREEDKALFERAKNANFDCYCGYDVPKSVRTLEKCDTEDYFWLAADFDRKEEMQKVLDIWKAEQTVWNKNTYHSLYAKEKELGDKERILRTAQEMYEWSRRYENDCEICSAADSLIKACLDAGEQELGKQVWREILPHVDSIYRPWYRLNLGRFLLEDSVDLAMHEADASEAAEIWNWAVPFLNKGMTGFSGNFWKKIENAAEKMGDKNLAQKAGQMLRQMEEHLRTLKET